MKILLIPSWYVTETRPDSGIYFRQKALALQEAGYDVGIVFVNNHWGYWREKLIKRQFFAKISQNDSEIPTVRIDIIGLPLRLSFLQKRYAQRVCECYEFYEAKYGKPDIIHAHGYLAAYAAACLKLRKNIPYIYTEHASFFKDQSFPKSHLPMIDLAAKQANEITAVSTSLRTWMKQNISKNIEIVPNMTNTSHFIYLPTQKNKEFVIVYVGDLIKLKSPQNLIKAFILLKKKTGLESVYLEIVGIGDLKKSLEFDVKQANLQKFVTFHGLLSSQKVAEKMKESNCLVLTSEIETFGIVLIEALASGLPIIATDCGGPSDIITPEVGILIPINDVDALAIAIEKIFLNQKFYNHKKIREIAIQKFGNEAVIKKWLQIYERVLSKK
jgi:glycosyltransferase involved in cell wall biosynthesis